MAAGAVTALGVIRVANSVLIVGLVAARATGRTGQWPAAIWAAATIAAARLRAAMADADVDTGAGTLDAGTTAGVAGCAAIPGFAVAAGVRVCAFSANAEPLECSHTNAKTPAKNIATIKMVRLSRAGAARISLDDGRVMPIGLISSLLWLIPMLRTWVSPGRYEPVTAREAASVRRLVQGRLRRPGRRNVQKKLTEGKQRLQNRPVKQ